MSKRISVRSTITGLHARAPDAISPLVLCDHLIQMAQEAERAGYTQTAVHLVEALERMFDTSPQRH